MIQLRSERPLALHTVLTSCDHNTFINILGSGRPKIGIHSGYSGICSVSCKVGWIFRVSISNMNSIVFKSCVRGGCPMTYSEVANINLAILCGR